jgi:hypothetical protein
MKKFIISIFMMLCCATLSAQSVIREGNTFSSVSTTSEKSETLTKYTWKDSKGETYPIYVSNTGSCYIKRVSKKTGKEYKHYLGVEISTTICKELGIKYEPKNK